MASVEIDRSKWSAAGLREGAQPMAHPSVAEDMRRIFHTAGSSVRAIGSSSGVHVLSPAPRRRRTARRGRIVGPLLAAACLVGAGIGLLVAGTAKLDPVTPAQPIAAHRSAISQPRADMVIASAPRAAVTGTPAPAPAAPIAAPPHFQGAAFRVTAPFATDVSHAAPSARQMDCVSDEAADDPACLRGDVLAADRDLRDAYLRAAGAGVERGRLVAIRNQWARLRAMDYDRPGALMDGYAELAGRLDRATARLDDALQ